MIQFRFLGGATILSIATAVGNSWIRDNLSSVLSPDTLERLFRSAETIGILPEDVRDEVQGYFVLSFNLQMRILIGVAVAAVFSSLMMWQKPQIRIP